MLQELHVQNFALIDDVGVEFHEGLNILSGETGAGKSIIMGSVNIALGAKASKDFIRHGCSSAYVELTFHLNEIQKERLLALDVEIDEDSTLVISRKITEQKSTSRINGETVNLNLLREAAAILIDIHGQQDNQTLTNPAKQLQLLDSYCGSDEQFLHILDDYNHTYSQYQQVLKTLDAFDLDESKRLREISYLEFVIDEINQAELVEGEEETLAGEFKKISNQKNIEEGFAHIRELLFDDASSQNGQSALLRVSQAAGLIQKLVSYDDSLSQIGESLADVESLLSDIEREFEAYYDSMDQDEEYFNKLQNRLDLIHDLKYKYGKNITEILDYQVEQEERLKMLQEYQINKEANEQKKSELFHELTKLSERLHELREKEAKPLAIEIGHALEDLNFLNAEFEIRVLYSEGDFKPNGCDRVMFYISPNPGEICKPIGEIASGGELSRIMLALKAVLANQDEIESFIFDEIDAGISGRTAQKVAEKLTQIASNHQIICISHLPQIVAMADYHYLIEKTSANNITKTEIKQLEYDESVTEIARLLSGTEVTQSVLDTAWEMKDLAQKSKYE